MFHRLVQPGTQQWQRRQGGEVLADANRLRIELQQLHLLGIADVAGKYYVPKLGAFIVYTLMIVILLVRPQGLFARAGGGK